jgi:hypothetical protein
MLRKTLVILLILLNLGWWVWARGWLAPIGLPATPPGEPERLARQVHPEALQVQPLSPASAAAPMVAPGSDADDAHADAAASAVATAAAPHKRQRQRQGN